MSIVQYLSNASERLTNARSILSTPDTLVLSCDTSLSGPYAEENKALETLYNNFDVFDTARQGDLSKADGIVSKEDLEAAALRDDEIGEAARYLLSRPDLLQFLDTGSNNTDYMDKVEEGKYHATGGDGRISQEDILAYLGKRTVNDILQEVHAQIDVEANGGNADGVLSRNDYEAFLRSGKATPEQALAIQMVLQHGAVDGEQGWTNRGADIAGTVGRVSGYVALGAAAVAAVMATGGVGSAALISGIGTFGTGMGILSTGASTTEMGLGIATHDSEHIISGGIGTVTGMVGGVNSGAVEQVFGNAARGRVIDAVVNGVTVGSNEGLNILADGNQAPDIPLDCDFENS